MLHSSELENWSQIYLFCEIQKEKERDSFVGERVPVTEKERLGEIASIGDGDYHSRVIAKMKQ